MPTPHRHGTGRGARPPWQRKARLADAVTGGDQTVASGTASAVEGAERASSNGAPATLPHRADARTGPEPRRDIRARTPYLTLFLASRDGYRKLARVASLLLIDLLGLAAAILSALALDGALEGDLDAGGWFAEAGDYLPLAILITILLFSGAGLYGPRETRPGPTRIVVALLQVTVASLAFSIVTGAEIGTYWLFGAGFAFAAAYVAGLRHLYQRTTGRILSSLGFRRRAALVGTGERIEVIGQEISREAGSSYEMVGYFSLDDRPVDELRDLGGLEDLPERLGQHAIEEVVIAGSEIPQNQAVRLIDECHARGVRVRVAPSTIEVMTRGAQLVPGQAVPLLEVRPPAFDGFDFVAKRTFDFLVAGIGLVVLSPGMALIALLIKATSRGPVLHRGLRPGMGGRSFRCLKFRTMYQDAEGRQSEVEHLNEAAGAIFKIRDDPRITPIGRFLRRNSLDELPQLINVLRGDMSLVGPRPLPLRDHARLEEWHRRRYLVLPGITGLWQISGRSNLGFDDMVRLDFLYLERWSIMLDVTILLKTVPAVIRRRGAY
jgi:exopolysaccharide biosynthesis polyprenyl glycosylphosphotransferase